eukprot:3560112-Amphidinium_carterae.2
MLACPTPRSFNAIGDEEKRCVTARYQIVISLSKQSKHKRAQPYDAIHRNTNVNATYHRLSS